MRTGAARIISVLSVAACVAAVVFGFVAYNDRSNLSRELEQLLQNSSCADSNDKDLCLFLSVWQTNPAYTLNASENKGDQAVNYRLQSDNTQDFHLTVESEQPRQTISKDGYIYALSGNLWQQQQISDPAERAKFRESSQLEFINQDNFGNFRPNGKEQCFDKECLVYIVTDGNSNIRVWFDKTDFRLRRVLVQSDGYNYNATVDYDQKVQISAPSDAKALASNQQLAPGGGQTSSLQTETPSDLAASGDSGLPATGDSGNPEDYQKWLEQRR